MEIRGPGDPNYPNGSGKMLPKVFPDPVDTQQLRVLRPAVLHGTPARLADLPPDPLGELLVGGQKLHAVLSPANLQDPLERVDLAGATGTVIRPGGLPLSFGPSRVCRRRPCERAPHRRSSPRSAPGSNGPRPG